jgi:hypothetical protein
MPTLILNSIECINPKETGHDEVIINVYTESSLDNLWRRYQYARIDWGPTRMEEEDTQSLRGAIDPIEFYEFVHIKVWDNDSPFKDNLIGELDFRRPFSYGENQFRQLPFGIIVGSNATCYLLRYDLLEEPSSRLRNLIDFVSLECNNAQGTKDRISLFANGIRVWGPHDMRTNDEETFNSVYYRFHDRLTVELYDERLQKWSDYLELRAREYQINRLLREVFVGDRGITGDYRYTLRYRMRWLPAS